MSSAPDPMAPAIAMESLSKVFGKVRAVRDLTLRVRRGEVLALLGPNGSGKSTTLKCVVGLIRATSGRILLEGIDPACDRIAALSRVSYLPQRLSFPASLTGWEVLRFYARLRRLPAEAVLASREVAGLNGALDRRLGGYSGGMVQRLGLGVLSLPDAPILILDEPTASLDPDTAGRFHLWLEGERRRGKTILFTTHRLEDATGLADRAAVLVGGKLAAEVATDRLGAGAPIEVTVALEAPVPGLERALDGMGLDDLESTGSSIRFGSSPGKALEALEALRRAGARISSFSTSSPLDRLYREASRADGAVREIS